MLAAAAALSFLSGILYGVFPALEATRVDVMPARKATRAGRPQAFRRVNLRHLLIVGQMAISLLMLVAAGLFIRTLPNLQSIELGFDRENLLLFKLDALKAGHKDPEIAAFYGGLHKQFSEIPGVQNATFERDSPIQGEHGLPIGVSGSPPDPANRLLTVGRRSSQPCRFPSSRAAISRKVIGTARRRGAIGAG